MARLSDQAASEGGTAATRRKPTRAGAAADARAGWAEADQEARCGGPPELIRVLALASRTASERVPMS